MTYKKIGYIIAGSFLLFTLSGCGNNNKPDEAAPEPTSQDAAEDSALSEATRAIAEYEQKYHTGTFVPEDYLALADLYAQTSQVKKQRDLLEQSYRLNDDADSFAALQEIVVNIKEEDSSLQEELNRLQQNLALPEYRSEAAGMLISNDFHTLMMPTLKEGRRNYYLTDQEQHTSLYLEIGYQGSTPYANVWYTNADNQVIAMMQTPETIHLLETGLADGAYQGDFSSWLCISAAGDTYFEQGTFENGIIAGDYTAQVRYGSEPVDLFSLFAGREDLELVTYSGNFDSNGITTLEQPADSKMQVAHNGNAENTTVIYAYHESMEKFLFIADSAEAEELVFDYQLLGLTGYPDYQEYEPAKDSAQPETALTGEATLQLDDIRVRIYDSNIEWFDGSRWHIMGPVEEYLDADPFLSYANANGANDLLENEESGDQEANDSAYRKRGSGTIMTENNTKKNASSSNKKNTNTQKPASPSSPAVPDNSGQKQQPTPGTPAVPGNETTGGSSGSDDSGGSGSSGGSGGNSGGSGGNSGGSGSSGGSDSGSDSGGSDSGSGSDSGGSDSGGSDSGGSNSGSGGGSDVDIEWTDDIM